MLLHTRYRICSRHPFHPILNHLHNETIKLLQTLTPTSQIEMASPKRPMCPSCVKPIPLCLCNRMKTPTLQNTIAVTVLQHSREKNHALNSTRIATLGLNNIDILWVSDVNFEAKFDIRTDWELNHNNALTFTVEKYGSLSKWQSHDFDKLLESSIARDAMEKGFTVKRFQKNEYEESQDLEITVPPGSILLFPSEKSIGFEGIDFEVKNLIVLDGTWAKAKRMYNENPWLQLLPRLKLDVDKLSLYGEVRSQPRAGYLSSIESIVYALKALGETDHQGLDALLDVFQSMVGDQRRCKDERLRKAGLI